MLEMQELSPESTNKKSNLWDSQDNIENPSNNKVMNNSGNEDQIIPQKKKKKKKSSQNFFIYQIKIILEKLSSSPTKHKILIITGLLIIISTLFMKLYCYFAIIRSLFYKIKKLRDFIFNIILTDVSYAYFYNLVNYFFLIIGFILFLSEIFSQFIIRYKTLLNVNECSLKPLILSKCFFMITLGLIPEVIFANVTFVSKKNIFLSFFEIKLLIQPYIIVILFAYFLYTLCFGAEGTKKEKILNEIKYIKNIINDFVDKYIFVWNNFNEKNINEFKKDNINNKEEKINNIENNLEEEKNIINNVDNGNVYKLKKSNRRKMSEEENESKKKLLSFDEEENEGEKKKKNFFVQKFFELKDRAELFFDFNCFKKLKRYIILGIILFILISPVINGIFGYGYYIFYESQVMLCYQLELLFCFFFGFILILLADD